MVPRRVLQAALRNLWANHVQTHFNVHVYICVCIYICPYHCPKVVTAGGCQGEVSNNDCVETIGFGLRACSPFHLVSCKVAGMHEEGLMTFSRIRIGADQSSNGANTELFWDGTLGQRLPRKPEPKIKPEDFHSIGTSADWHITQTQRACSCLCWMWNTPQSRSIEGWLFAAIAWKGSKQNPDEGITWKASSLLGANLG